MVKMELEYRPIPKEGELSYRNFDFYVIQKDLDEIVRAIIIGPFEEKLKSMERAEFNFGTFVVKRSIQKQTNLSWKKVYSHLLTFLDIRAIDSRRSRIKGLRKVEGVGYCIRFDELFEEIERAKKESTNISEYPVLNWPRKKKGEKFPRKIQFPRRNYSKKTEENAKICLQAKRFCSGLEKEVKDAYYFNNRAWFKEQTGFVWYKERRMKDKSILPSKDESPVDRERDLGDTGRKIYIILSRKEDPDYARIINDLIEDLEKIKKGQVVEHFRNPQDVRDFVCITSILNRIDLNNIKKENNLFKKYFKVSGKYIISPP